MIELPFQGAVCCITANPWRCPGLKLFGLSARVKLFSDVLVMHVPCLKGKLISAQRQGLGIYRTAKASGLKAQINVTTK
nr:hypothetical protein [Bacteroidota bacterium]